MILKPENKIIKHGTTIVTADGDDFVVDRSIKGQS